MMQDQNSADTRIATVVRNDEGIIVITMKECGEIDEYDVVDLNLVIRHLAKHQPARKLLISTADFELTKKAKEMAEKEDNLSKTIARAIVISSNLKVSVMNFLRKFGEKSYPQQFFTEEAEAYEWLRQQPER